MRKLVLLRHAVRSVIYAGSGAFVVLLVLAVLYLDNQPDLEVWHQAELDAEFTADSPVRTFEDYLRLEDRLFRQLDEHVYARIGAEDRLDINRYNRDSLSDPRRWPRNWNRSFEFGSDAPRLGVLLLHGMSDAPYSLHSLGERLNAAGAQVLGLRLPGHGTAPVGLTTVRWEDMAAAVRLAMRHLREELGDKPLYIIGYSNGGALAVEYALSALRDASLPPLAGVVLISPAIGVSPVAALAVWQARLGHLLRLPKLEWNSVQPEYDPFKYNSFAVNAGNQVYRLTGAIQSRFDTLDEDELARFPPLLAFQSVVDATVSPRDLVHGLFDRLPSGRHELVGFDLNRVSGVVYLLRRDPGPALEALMRKPDRDFTLTLLANAGADSSDIVIRRAGPGETSATRTTTTMKWPQDVYSLAHIALPFRGDDPLYGGDSPARSPGIRLGKLALRGERGVLRISATDMLRLHWNPFYDYLQQRVLAFVQAAD